MLDMHVSVFFLVYLNCRNYVSYYNVLKVYTQIVAGVRNFWSLQADFITLTGEEYYTNHDREEGYPSPNEYRLKIEIFLLVRTLILSSS